MKTKTIGEILQSERRLHRLSLEKMAQKTRIKLRYLQALEDNRFAELPAATFVKGYIKTYASVLGFEHQPLIAILRRDYKESAKGRLVPREFLRPVLKKRQFWGPASFLVLGLATVFLTLIAYVAFQWYQLAQPPELKLFRPADDDLVASRVQVVGQTEADVILTVNSAPVALQPDGAFQTEIYLSREGVNTIFIEAQDRQGRKTLLQRTVRVKF